MNFLDNGQEWVKKYKEGNGMVRKVLYKTISMSNTSMSFEDSMQCLNCKAEDE